MHVFWKLKFNLRECMSRSGIARRIMNITIHANVVTTGSND